jgi:hypothetical protein
MTKSESETKGAQPEPAEQVTSTHAVMVCPYCVRTIHYRLKPDSTVFKDAPMSGAEPVSASTPEPVAWRRFDSYWRYGTWSGNVDYSDDGGNAYEFLYLAAQPEPVSARPASDLSDALRRHVAEVSWPPSDLLLRVADALQARPASEPTGWKLVPIQPTAEMIEAAANTPGIKAIDASSSIMQLRGNPLNPKDFETGSPLQQSWRAMLAAAPDQAAKTGEIGEFLMTPHFGRF